MHLQLLLACEYFRMIVLKNPRWSENGEIHFSGCQHFQGLVNYHFRNLALVSGEASRRSFSNVKFFQIHKKFIDQVCITRTCSLWTGTLNSKSVYHILGHIIWAIWYEPYYMACKFKQTLSVILVSIALK